MGGIGSGRYPPVGLEKRPVRPSGRMAQADRISQRVLVSTLKLAERDLKKGEIPSSGVIDLARWAHEMRAGKPTVKLDADVNATTTLVLDPSRMLERLRERELIEAEYRLCNGNVINSTGNVGKEPYSLMMSQIAHFVNTPSCLVPDWEDGCRSEDSLRNVSESPEKIMIYPSEVDITFENGRGI